MIRQIEIPEKKTQIAAQILHALPEWFGLPESTAEYIREGVQMPFWAAFENDVPVGFIAMKETGPAAAEIYVMGVLPGFHRKGIGRQLVAALETFARANGFRFLQVKTVRQGCYPEYDLTNAFYRAVGFDELECFPTLWGENNPCQIYIKVI